MPRIIRILSGIAMLLIPVLTSAQNEQPPLSIEEMMRQSIYSRMPRGLGWLPVGDRFTRLERSEGGELQLVIRAAATGETVQRLTPRAPAEAEGDGGPGHRGMSLGGMVWLPDGSGFVFSHGGDIWQMALTDDLPTRLTETPASEREIGLDLASRRLRM